MQSLKSIVAVALLALWLPCTAHCQMESLGLFGANSDCCERGDASSGERSDCHDCAICQSVESGGYFVVKQPLLTPAVFTIAIEFLAVEAVNPDALRPRRAPDFDSRQVLLAQSWQFDSRASALPRAPSSAS